MTPGGRTGTTKPTTTKGRTATDRRAPTRRSTSGDRPTSGRASTSGRRANGTKSSDRRRATTTWGLGEDLPPRPAPRRRSARTGSPERGARAGGRGLADRWAAGRRRPGPLARRLAEVGIGVDAPHRRGAGRRAPARRSATSAPHRTGTSGRGGAVARGGAARSRRRDLVAAPGLLRRLVPGPSTIRRSRRGANRRARAGRVSPRRRAITLLCVFGLLFVVVVVRLADVQVARSGRYVSYGEAQRIEPITLPASRGTLFDRNNDELAISMPTKSVFADPHLIANPALAAEALSPVLHMTRADLRAKLRSDGKFVYLARRVDDRVARAVAALHIEGISFIEEPKRYYPGGSLGRSLLGEVGVDGDGLSGLELAYESELQGTPGELIREVDPQGNTIPAGRQHVDPAAPGDDLVLTIDRGMQYETENILARHIERVGAKGGIAIISNPETGEILTLANMERDGAGKVTNTGNDLAVTANFEPGSVNKVITMSAALEEGIVTPDTTLSVPDSLRVADHTFGDSHSHPTESYTVTQILAESSNIGTIKIAQMLGADKIDEYLRRFGFGEKTALGLPHENSGQLLPADKWWGTSIGSIPIGQGISVTAMQLLYAYNTIANDGIYLPPSLVSATLDKHGDRHPEPRGAGHRVVSPTTAAQVRAMLAQVVTDGTGTAAAIPGYDVAGKTGTARKPQRGGGYTDANGAYHHVATFAGFAPAAKPKLSIIVVLDEPSTSPYAGTVAAPAFAEIGRYALRHLGIPPATAMDTGDGGGTRVRSTPAAGPTPPTSVTTATAGATTTTRATDPAAAATTTTAAGAAGATGTTVARGGAPPPTTTRPTRPAARPPGG